MEERSSHYFACAFEASLPLSNLTAEDVDYVMRSFKWDDGRTEGLAIIIHKVNPLIDVKALWSASLRYMKWDDGRCNQITLLLSSGFVPSLKAGTSLIKGCMKWGGGWNSKGSPEPKAKPKEPPFPLNLPYDYLLRRYQQQGREVKESLLKNPEFIKRFTPHVLKEMELEFQK